MLKVVTQGTRPYRLIMVDQYAIDYKRYNNLDKRLPPILRTLNRINVLYIKDKKKAKVMMYDYPNMYLKPNHIFKRRVSPSEVVPYTYYLIIGINVGIKRTINKKIVNGAFKTVSEKLYPLGVTSITLSLPELITLLPLKTLLPIILEHTKNILIDIELETGENMCDKDMKYIKRALNKK